MGQTDISLVPYITAKIKICKAKNKKYFGRAKKCSHTNDWQIRLNRPTQGADSR